MKIYETLARDPRTQPLANSGQARITSDTDERAVAELRAELETFVCDGQYGDAIERILGSYLRNLNNPKQDAAWVSGFFGSGKSHLLKMLGHLWVDTPFSDGATARSLVEGLPEDVKAHLQELDTLAKRGAGGLMAAAGTLPAGSGDHVKLTVLSIILEAAGLPQNYAQANFCFWLKEQGFYEKVRGAVEESGKEWLKELNNLYVSGLLANAVLACDANFAGDEKEARQTLRDQFPNKSEDITTEEFLGMARNALEVDGELPLTILVLDEVQQYIGDSTDRAVAFTEVTEAIYTQLDSKIMLVASGQSALSGTPQLQKLKDRYRINAQLSDTDVEAVTRKVLLRKNPSRVAAIKVVLDENTGELAKHLDGTRLSARSEDARIIVEDYPLLPSRRRFWEECFRAVDAAGTHSQLRSQLRILHDTLTEIAERELGAVIPADARFVAIAPNRVHTGVLLNEIDLRIRKLDDGSETGTLRRRMCGLVFLISKLPRETGSDVGVRATARTIADLMVDDLPADSGPFRKQIENELEQLASDGTLMKVGDEFRLQTTEGAAWDGAYREKVGALRQREADIAVKRDQMLGEAIQKMVGTVKLLHGESKERRDLTLYSGSEDPPTGSDQVVVWLRDGWSIPLKEVEADARRRGQEDHVIHLFLPRMAAEDLTTSIIEVEATRQVIDLKGVRSTNEGREARESMQSRSGAAQQILDELIHDIIASARVFQGGGAEVFGESLVGKLDVAAEKSLARLFPEFGDGDHKSWGIALKRARDGSDEPLKIVGWDKATEDHPVVRQVLTEVGAGARGSAVRKALQSSPYGWPRDAIDAALIALHREGSIRAELNGQPVRPGNLDQNKVPTADFRPEKVRMTASDKLAVRGLYQKAGLSVKTGDEESKASEFLRALRELASKAGGEAPLPDCPTTKILDDLDQLNGSEQLGQILTDKEELERSFADWAAIGERVATRLPIWQRLEQMAHHTSALPIHEELEPELRAIVADRSLLDETDHVTPLATKAANALRSALTERTSAFQTAYDRGLETLTADSSWQQLDDAARETILAKTGLVTPAPLVTTTDVDILNELDRSSFEARDSALDALSERLGHALEAAAQILKPDARRVELRAATLEDAPAVKAWLEEHEAKLLDAVTKGPVIVG